MGVDNPTTQYTPLKNQSVLCLFLRQGSAGSKFPLNFTEVQQQNMDIIKLKLLNFFIYLWPRAKIFVPIKGPKLNFTMFSRFSLLNLLNRSCVRSQTHLKKMPNRFLPFNTCLQVLHFSTLTSSFLTFSQSEQRLMGKSRWFVSACIVALHWYTCLTVKMKTK